jgi:uncharacterized damage-inducible protein DinB
MDEKRNELESLAHGYRFNERLFIGALAGLAGDDWLRRAAEGASHAYWILGHIARTRRGLLRGLGVEVAEAPWEAAFARGTRPGSVLDPEPEALQKDFLDSGRRIAVRLAAMSREEAAAPFGRTLPDGSSTREGAAQFLLRHESYHLGQLGLLRRVCGKPGVA